MFLQNYPRYPATFWSVLKNITFHVIIAVATFWHFLENFGYFQFQHLVTLLPLLLSPALSLRSSEAIFEFFHI